MSSRDQIRATLSEIVSIELDEKIALKDEQKLVEELGLDSVDIVSLVMQVERQFRIRMTHDELSGTACVGDLISLVEQKLQQPAQATTKAA